MTDGRGAVFDLGYVPHDGPRLGRAAAIRSTVKDGARRVLGIRRKARRKIIPWVLFGIALIPAVFFVGLAFFVSSFTAGESPFDGHAEYFDIVGNVTLLFLALAGPELLIRDRTDNVLAVYSSRPLSARDYLVSRAAGLALVGAGFLVVPQLLMYLGFATLDDRGLVPALLGDWPELLRILGATAGYLVGYGAIAFLIAVYAKRVGPAAGIYLATIFVGTGVSTGLAESGTFTGARYFALGAIAEHPVVIRDWLFDRSTGTAITRAGFDPWVSVAFLAALLVAVSFLAYRRYRNLL